MDRKNAWTTYSKEELDRLEQVNTEYKNCLDAGKTERLLKKSTVSVETI